jgi:hypothetical protein
MMALDLEATKHLLAAYRGCGSPVQAIAEQAVAEVEGLRGLLLRCAVHGQEVADDGSRNRKSLEAALTADLDEIPAMVSATVAGMECRAARALAEVERLRLVVECYEEMHKTCMCPDCMAVAERLEKLKGGRDGKTTNIG